MALDATPGGPASNAYCDVATATSLLAERLGTDAWTAATSQEHETSLIQATRLLDQQMRWLGTPTTDTQALEWPRTGAYDCRRRPIPPDVIPSDVQRATAEYALALLEEDAQSGGTTTVAEGTIKSQTLGETRIEYFQPGTTTTAQRGTPSVRLPLEIRQMLTCYGRATGGVTLPLART